MDSDAFRDRCRGVAAWLDASPAEVAGLAVLLAGAVAVVGVLWWTGRPVPVPVPPTLAPDVEVGSGAAGEEPPGGDTVTVHVAGAVGRPGLVRLDAGARVADAIDAAGGLVLDADPSSLNLARAVTDGERVDVPRVGDVVAGPPSAGDGGGASAGQGRAVRPDGTLDLNLATADDLEQLPGVGPVLAGRIVDWRQANGPFTGVGQLREVSGIGEKTFQSLAPLVAV